MARHAPLLAKAPTQAQAPTFASPLSAAAARGRLSVGPVQDGCEQEAGRVSRTVMQGSLAGARSRQGPVSTAARPGGPVIQRAPATAAALPVSASVEAGIAAARGGGQPLAADVRAPMERSFGVDFSRVRIHADPAAAALNRSLQARAFTTGHDIFFRRRAYNPGTIAGRALLVHELTHVVQQQGGAPSGVIQRDVGFEYELTLDTYRAAAPLTADQRLAFTPPEGFTPLTKGDVIVGDMNGLHAKADQGGVFGSNLELETEPVPDTRTGRARLNAMLKTAERLCDLLKSEGHQGHHQIGAADLQAAFGGTVEDSQRSIRVPTTQAILGNPQATVGVRLGRVADMMEQQIGLPTSETGKQHPVKRVELGSLGDQTMVGDAPEQVRRGITTFSKDRTDLPSGFPSPELVSLCALILPYIRKGADPRKYAKEIAPIMARTDFGSIFHDVPIVEQGVLGHADGALFAEMWKDILAAAGVAGGLEAQLFAQEPFEAEKEASLSESLTRDAWLRCISIGHDLLTRSTFPSVPGRADMEGMGALGRKHDIVGQPGARVAAPVLELRRIMTGVNPHDFAEMAMGVFDYIVALNKNRQDPSYARVKRAASTVTAGQNRRYTAARELTT